MFRVPRSDLAPALTGALLVLATAGCSPRTEPTDPGASRGGTPGRSGASGSPRAEGARSGVPSSTAASGLGAAESTGTATSTRASIDSATDADGALEAIVELAEGTPLPRAVGVVRRMDHLYAVGRAPPMKNRALARAVASNRARARLVRALGENGVSISHISGVDIVEHWTDPRTGAMFARARLDERSPHAAP